MGSVAGTAAYTAGYMSNVDSTAVVEAIGTDVVVDVAGKELSNLVPDMG